MHVFAFKPIDRLLNDQWLKEPLYKKHATSMDENSKLPHEILEREANNCADFLNSLESPLMLGGYLVEALAMAVPIEVPKTLRWMKTNLASRKNMKANPLARPHQI